MAQILGRFGFRIRQTGSTIEEFSGKHLCIRIQLELVEREKQSKWGKARNPNLHLIYSEVSLEPHS